MFVHHPISTAAPVRGELAIGWTFHYAVGIVYAAIYLLIVTVGLHAKPSFISALLFAWVTLIAPWFVMQHLDMHQVRQFLLASGVVVAFLAGAVALTPTGAAQGAAWIEAAYWFTASTSFANPAITIAFVIGHVRRHSPAGSPVLRPCTDRSSTARVSVCAQKVCASSPLTP